MVDFAVKVQNPNKTVEAIDPVIEVVGKDDSGNVIFDETIETPGCVARFHLLLFLRGGVDR